MGYHTQTQGICILYPVEKKYPFTFFDTSGTNFPIRKEKMKKDLDDLLSEDPPHEINKKLMIDNLMTENFQQTFIMQNSHVLLIVINRLQREDERMIERILHNKLNKDSKVYVVHNLKNTQEIEDVENIIKNDIIDSFPVTAKKILKDFDSCYDFPHVFVEERPSIWSNESPVKIEHVILAQEGSKAAEKYNKVTFEYLRSAINQSSDNNAFDFVS
mmetsp:Transcript_18222/g.15881  ORF Transcript_18222/g.15881 Transcript_18222/m.15881 type:complete len:216 (+) Transcript_18222:360-1007(+)|eukprot:CAMPEP_0114593700 /NCGR_PEP_ID=MMETSP0125-20121206/15292_1 /TAXON_ID=485358 ORGANISM="Aristerostoma sp., Strain ATCC 50986" /NCGR_SAMPLE_ID=MMETSP0125 /ASSEMBLY_ACC=CAM_ASM_000245 /LENGTH=215 /DNA_ID=CAMNT_0001793137 /DNA_START=360 /DNA_END=1007 /DNA_ORIENTATION=-